MYNNFLLQNIKKNKMSNNFKFLTVKKFEQL